MCAAHPLDDPCGRNLRDDDEEGVDEDDDADLARPDRRVRLRERREDVGKQRAAGHHEHDVGGDQDEEEPIVSNCSEACSPVARRRSLRKARIRDPHEHNQREDSEGCCIEKVERLEHAKVIGGSDDEARDRRPGAHAEIARDAAERDRGGALLRRDQGQTQNLVRGSRDSETGAADDRADEALPGTVDECETSVAQCAHEIAGDQDRLRTETIEQRTRQGRYDRRRAHDRRQHQPRGRRWEAAGLVQVDDLEGKDQSSAEVVDRGPSLKNDDRPRQARPPAGEHTSERPARLRPAVGCFPVRA